jgi:hypothetical protein
MRFRPRQRVVPLRGEAVEAIARTAPIDFG